MADWPDESWVLASGEALAAAAPHPGGVSGTVAVEVVGGGPYWRTWVDGVPVAGGAGKPAAPADVTVTVIAADARAFWAGEWSASVGFMRGRLKMSGSMAVLLPLLADSERWGGEGPLSVVAALPG
jgi:hypothetical protein